MKRFSTHGLSCLKRSSNKRPLLFDFLNMFQRFDAIYVTRKTISRCICIYTHIYINYYTYIHMSKNKLDVLKTAQTI